MTDTVAAPALRACNVLVIGAGAAGLRAAIAAHTAGVEVLVVGSRPRGDAHTGLAAGGINAVLGTHDPDDSPGAHFADTYLEGHEVADPAAVELLAREAPDAIRELAAWGCEFTRTDDGAIDQRYFGAHRYRRTCYAGDHTGRAVLDTLLARVDALGIPIVEGTYVSRLLVDDGVCFGAYGFDARSGTRTAYLADATVLATGGHTRLWRLSSSRRGENYGDGMHLALEAGADLADMELVQFHPTGMTHPEEWAGTLVTEAVRGEGGRLFNSDGERYMRRYDPERLELSARDVVAAANYTEIHEGRAGPHGGVFLDVTHLSRDDVARKLSRIHRQFLDVQMLDISSQRMEVAPTAHYSMGGVVVDHTDGTTTVAGLHAAGEVTTGVHGANRLGGNSLSETVVFGRRAGEAAARRSRSLGAAHRSAAALRDAEERLDRHLGGGGEYPLPMLRRVRDLMWSHCGVLRSEERLSRGLDELGGLGPSASDLDVRPDESGWTDLVRACSLRAALVCAEATLRGALERRESRGAHRRSDHPGASEPARNLLVRLAGGTLELTPVDVPPVPQRLRPELDRGAVGTGGERLLE